MLAPVLDAVRPIRQCRRRPRRRPAKLHADKAYDHAACRRACRERRIVPRIARRGIDSSERLGRYRWIVERTLAWFARFRRLAASPSATSAAPTSARPSTISPPPSSAPDSSSDGSVRRS
jgi:transposase